VEGCSEKNWLRLFFQGFWKSKRKVFLFFVFRKKLFCCWFLFLFPIFWVFGLSAFVICYETFISLHRHETDRLFSLFWIFISCTASKNFVLKLLLIFFVNEKKLLDFFHFPHMFLTFLGSSFLCGFYKWCSYCRFFIVFCYNFFNVQMFFKGFYHFHFVLCWIFMKNARKLLLFIF